MQNTTDGSCYDHQLCPATVETTLYKHNKMWKKKWTLEGEGGGNFVPETYVPGAVFLFC